MILDRYLIAEVAKPLLAVCAILAVIFVSYSSAVYLADAASGLLPADTVLILVLLKTVISMETLLPIALYLSVVVGLGRLYTDYEMTALAAAGVGSAHVLRAVGRLCLVVAVVVGCLSLYGRPWAYQQSYRLEAAAEARIEVDRLEAGQFYNSSQAQRTVFVESLDGADKRMEEVFVQNSRGDRSQIIYAREAHQPDAADGDPRRVVFSNGYFYELDRDGTHDRILKFGELTLDLVEPSLSGLGSARKAAPTWRLADSDNLKDVAELQWRLSTPLATVLLGLLGVPLSRTKPRQGRYAKLLSAVLLYAAYYNVSAVAKTWLEQGQVPPLPGIWWVHALLAILLATLLWRPIRHWRYFRARLRRQP